MTEQCSFQEEEEDAGGSSGSSSSLLYDSGVAQDQDSRTSSPESVVGADESVRQTTEVWV